jgi:hypothetical protein
MWLPSTAMDAVSSSTIGWWACNDCGVDVELPDLGAAGFLVECPECAGPMTEQWSWDAAA